MEDHKLLYSLVQQYEKVKFRYIEAVGSSSEKKELNYLQRQLEDLASQVRKVDANHKL